MQPSNQEAWSPGYPSRGRGALRQLRQTAMPSQQQALQRERGEKLGGSQLLMVENKSETSKPLAGAEGPAARRKRRHGSLLLTKFSCQSRAVRYTRFLDTKEGVA